MVHLTQYGLFLWQINGSMLLKFYIVFDDMLNTSASSTIEDPEYE